MDSYIDFARYYDSMMEDARYAERCRYLIEIAERFHHPMGLTLDLACGTGSLTRELKKSGVDVYGVDASEDMLCEAVGKNYEEGLDILYLNQRMEELDLYGTVDTCVCTLDSLNHITDEKALQRAFDRLGVFMNPNGLFIFDVNTVYKHKKVLSDNAFILENDKVFCVWQNFPDENNIVNITLDFFEEEDGIYYRSSESFSERAYTDGELSAMLERAGFAIEAVYGDLSFEPPKEDEQRAVYVARRLSDTKDRY